MCNAIVTTFMQLFVPFCCSTLDNKTWILVLCWKGILFLIKYVLHMISDPWAVMVSVVLTLAGHAQKAMQAPIVFCCNYWVLLVFSNSWRPECEARKHQPPHSTLHYYYKPRWEKHPSRLNITIPQSPQTEAVKTVFTFNCFFVSHTGSNVVFSIHKDSNSRPYSTWV